MASRVKGTESSQRCSMPLLGGGVAGSCSSSSRPSSGRSEGSSRATFVPISEMPKDQSVKRF